VIRKRTLQRYFKYCYSVNKANCFKKISAQNEWWEDALNEEEQEPVSKKITKWLQLVASVKKAHKINSMHAGTIHTFSQIKMKFRPSPSRTRFSFISIPELRDPPLQQQTCEKVSLPLINRHRKRRHTRMRDLAPLTKVEEVMREFNRMRVKLEFIALTVEQLQRNILRVESRLKAREARTGSNEAGLSHKELSIEEGRKEAENSLRDQLRRLLIEANSSMSKNEILQRLNEIVYPERESAEDVFADSYETSENSSRAISPELDSKRLQPIINSAGLKKHSSLRNFSCKDKVEWRQDSNQSEPHEDPSNRTAKFETFQELPKPKTSAAKTATAAVPDESQSGDARVLPQFYTTILGTNPNLTRPQPDSGPSLFSVANRLRLRVGKAFEVFFKKRGAEGAETRRSSSEARLPLESPTEPLAAAKLANPTKTLRTNTTIIKISKRLRIKVDPQTLIEDHQ